MITNATLSQQWRKSTYSSDNGGDCVEVAGGLAAVPVRDSKAPALGHLTIAHASWSALLDRVRRS
ncbi:DUF397 domain-containing protein [Embleya sp. NBC_00888]|uniref:DUF397 domain-containing protein n=1 Tax=Embleya sp. NBC_00888 TaxID=2975960 RepID=UPI003867C341|nr:DUF397 domain-containing protein [Embleya sp. NBC_00888]